MHFSFKIIKDQVRRIPQKGKRIALAVIRASLHPWRTSIDVFRSGGLGDALMCTPALRALKQVNPNCQINFYTNFPGLVRGLWYLDKVDYIDNRPKGAMLLAYEDVRDHSVRCERRYAARRAGSARCFASGAARASRSPPTSWLC